MAEQLGGEPLVQLIRASTYTCCLGMLDRLYELSFGCATCPSCELRVKGSKGAPHRAPLRNAVTVRTGVTGRPGGE
jgi:7-cyano-7-deazaguanine synthase